MLLTTRAFQEHDQSQLNSMKLFFIQFATSLENGQSAISQITTSFKQNLEKIDVEEIMLQFQEEKGTGCEKPR